MLDQAENHNDVISLQINVATVVIKNELWLYRLEEACRKKLNYVEGLEE